LNSILRWFPKLDCNNPDCQLRGPIFLPCPIHRQISVDQPNWPMDDWQAFAVCHVCGYGYMYTKDDVRWGRGQDSDLWQSNVFVQISLKCDRAGCQSPVLAFAFWPIPALSTDIQCRMVYGDGSPVCENGHFLAFPILVIDVEGISHGASL
jgi:hypothetical protein